MSLFRHLVGVCICICVYYYSHSRMSIVWRTASPHKKLIWKRCVLLFRFFPNAKLLGFETFNDIFHLDRTDIRSFSRPLFLNHAGCRTLICRFNYIILWSIIAFNKSYLIFLMCSIFSVFLIKINLYIYFFRVKIKLYGSWYWTITHKLFYFLMVLACVENKR